MRTTDALLKSGWLAVLLALGAVVELSAQDTRPARPTPPLPPMPVPMTPGVRSSLLRAAVETNRLAPAAVPQVPVPQVSVPQVPVPLLHPPIGPANPVTALAMPAATQVTNPGALVYDAEQKDYSAKLGEATASFTFNLTNVSEAEVLINRVTTSCGCTVAKLPQQPWHLAAGANGPINVSVDLRGKSGTIMKTVSVDSTAGMKTLLVKITIPPPQAMVAGASPMDRNRNLELAKADRQAVFKSDCAECHVKPALGKVGKELYAGACAVCHDAEHRATMVPDLHVLKHPETREYWTHAVAEGKVNSLMPAFGQKHGGFLTESQIVSLVDYLMTGYAGDTSFIHHAAAGPLPPVIAPQARFIPPNNSSPSAPVGASAQLGPFPIK